MRLTENQIKIIDVSLKEIGMVYRDIRMEMTDHIASVLEENENDFEQRIIEYIAVHKKELREQHRKLAVLAWINSWKAFGFNILTFRFVGMFSSIFIFLFSLCLYIEVDSLMPLLFIGFCAVNVLVSLPSVIHILKKKDQYSLGEGLGIINLFIFFPGIFAASVASEYLNETGVLLYFTTLITVSLMLGSTLISLKKKVKINYHA